VHAPRFTSRFALHTYFFLCRTNPTQVLEDAARKAEEEQKRAAAAAEAAAARDRANYARQQLSLENVTVLRKVIRSLSRPSMYLFIYFLNRTCWVTRLPSKEAGMILWRILLMFVHSPKAATRYQVVLALKRMPVAVALCRRASQKSACRVG
jgi:hypothetical protein